MPTSKRTIIALTGKAGSGKDTVADYIEQMVEHDPTNVREIVRLGFADPVRAGARQLYGLSSEEITDRVLKEEAKDRKIVFPTSASPYGDYIGQALIAMFGEDQSVWQFPRTFLFNKLSNFINKEFYVQQYGFACRQSPRKLMQRLGTEWGRMMVSDSLWVDWLQKRIEIGEKNAETIGSPIVFVINDLRFENEAELIKKLNGKVIRLEREDASCDNSGHASEQFVPKAKFVIDNNGTLGELYEKIDDVLFNKLKIIEH